MQIRLMNNLSKRIFLSLFLLIGSGAIAIWGIRWRTEQKARAFLTAISELTPSNTSATEFREIASRMNLDWHESGNCPDRCEVTVELTNQMLSRLGLAKGTILKVTAGGSRGSEDMRSITVLYGRQSAPAALGVYLDFSDSYTEKDISGKIGGQHVYLITLRAPLASYKEIVGSLNVSCLTNHLGCSDAREFSEPTAEIYRETDQSGKF
jgi:hypothetical protein